MNQVRLFRAVDLNGCMFGQELIQQLLASEAGTVPHGNWFDKEISVREAAEKITKKGCHAVHFHPIKDVWYFASPAHRRAAESLSGRRAVWSLRSR